MTEILFSVVVPTFNRLSEITKCVDAIAQSSFDRDRFEVIVVNDGGEDPRTVLECADSRVGLRVVSQPNRGSGAARNHGGRLARGKFLVFTDDDCMPDEDWLTRLEESVTRYPLALNGGRTVNLLRGNPFSETSQGLIDYVHSYYNDTSANRTGFFASNNIALSAAMFEAVGGFDESLWAAEDRDFCRTWHNGGGTFRYVPDAVVYHAHHLTLRSLQKQHFTYGRGALPYWKKASPSGIASLRVEPLSFYAGMLIHPFSRNMPNPALIAALIVISQFANAAGFVYEAFRTRARGSGVFKRSRANPDAM